MIGKIEGGELNSRGAIYGRFNDDHGVGSTLDLTVLFSSLGNYPVLVRGTARWSR